MSAEKCRGGALAESGDVNISGLKFVHFKADLITVKFLAELC